MLIDISRKFPHLLTSSFCKVYLLAATGAAHSNETGINCFKYICGDIADARISGVLVDVVKRSPLADLAKVRSSLW